MRFTTLTLSDFGVFRGRHTISLAARPGRPLILFGGKNGAGKTTLLEAIRLCLYGPASIGTRISKEEYLRYLESRIHHNPQCLIQPSVASVGIEFQYGDVDGLHTYAVTRSWERRSSHKVLEDLRLERDGKPLDEISSDHWQDFLRDLIPPGLSQFFFFDGEKIQQLAEDTTDRRTLAESIKALLGVDAVERLQTDLGIYLSRFAKTTSSRKDAREVEELEHEVERVRAGLDHARCSIESRASTLEQLKTAVASIEEKIASQGGGLARNREDLIREQADLRARTSQVEDAIRQSCTGLLPFGLVPSLCCQLKEQLLREERQAQHDAATWFLKSAKEEIGKRLDASDFWIGLQDLSEKVKVQIRNRLDDAIDAHLRPPVIEGAPIIHQITGAAQKQLLHWIEEALADVPNAMRTAARELERLYRELHRVEDALRKIPADEVLRPLLEELRDAHEKLAVVAREVLSKDEEIHTLELRLTELERRYAAALQKVAAEATQRSRVRLVPQVQKVLEDYKGVLLVKRVLELENSLTECFKSLCRKNDEVRRITINPQDFSVTLYDRQDRPLPQSRLSAGEKQIYAISVLWALAKTSGRPLPMIIDTPLARLDSDHRKLLVKHYFPAASHQVLVLSTDTEVDQSYFAELRRAIGQAYELEFNALESSSKIRTGYFW